MSETIEQPVVNNDNIKLKESKNTPEYVYNAIKKYRENNKEKIKEYQKNYERNKRDKQKQEKLDMEAKIKSLEEELNKVKLENEELKKKLLRIKIKCANVP